MMTVDRAFAIVALVLAAVFLVRHLARTRVAAFPPLPVLEPPGHHEETLLVLEGDRRARLALHAAWLIQMRWVVVLAAGFLVLGATLVLDLLPPATHGPLGATVAAIAFANLVFSAWRTREGNVVGHVVAQVLVDLALLTLLLHYSGGIENPLFPLYLLHVILAGIILPRGTAHLLALVAVLLFSVMALGEWAQLIPHYTNRLFPHGAGHDDHGVTHASHQALYTFGRTGAFIVLTGVVGYLTTLVAGRLRASEDRLAELARVATDRQHKLERVVDAAGVGMVLLGRDLGIRWANQRAHLWLGRDRRPLEGGEETGGRSLMPWSIPSADGPEGSSPSLAMDALRTGRTRQGEQVVKTAGGADRYLHVVVSPVPGHGRAPPAELVVILQDLTERRDLEARVHHNARMAALGRLAAGVAHEVGNPLSSLLARLGLLERDRRSEFVEETIGVFRAQLGRIERIVRGIVQFARPTQVAWASIDVNGILAEALHLARLDRRSKGVRFEEALAPDLPATTGVRDQIVQVCLNIMLNGIEAMPEGGVLRVESRALDGWIRITVADTGAGMTPEVRARLYTPFFTTKQGGMGLGLSISESLVVAHGGHMEVESEPGKGTRFVVSLPVRRVGTDRRRGR